MPMPIPIRICGAEANSASTIASAPRRRTRRNEREIASIRPTSPSTSPAGTYTNGSATTRPTSRLIPTSISSTGPTSSSPKSTTSVTIVATMIVRIVTTAWARNIRQNRFRAIETDSGSRSARPSMRPPTTAVASVRASTLATMYPITAGSAASAIQPSTGVGGADGSNSGYPDTACSARMATNGATVASTMNPM